MGGIELAALDRHISRIFELSVKNLCGQKEKPENPFSNTASVRYKTMMARARPQSIQPSRETGKM